MQQKVVSFKKLYDIAHNILNDSKHHFICINTFINHTGTKFFPIL